MTTEKRDMFKTEICMRVLPVSTLLIYKSGLVLVREEGIAGALITKSYALRGKGGRLIEEIRYLCFDS